jgi:hypothetical protein
VTFSPTKHAGPNPKENVMTATTTTPHTVSLRPATLAALLATTVAASIGATWGAVHVADGGPAEHEPAVSSVTPDTQAYIDGITSMTSAQLAAAFGYNNYPEPSADDVTAVAP